MGYIFGYKAYGLHALFSGASSFNQAIGNWNVSSVTNMKYMFYNAAVFNQPINDWDTSSVTKMAFMFRGASSFNQVIGNWDMSSVTEMKQMFFKAAAFNQPLNDWDTSSVTNMDYMFQGASALSDTNKGKIHEAFSVNKNWTYDWSEFVEEDTKKGDPDDSQSEPKDKHPIRMTQRREIRMNRKIRIHRQLTTREQPMRKEWTLLFRFRKNRKTRRMK